MKKIYFVLILCVSSYGFSNSFLGVGGKNCSHYLEEAENTTPTFYIYASFAQGTFMTMNMFSDGKVLDNMFGERYFVPDGTTLERVLTKHCEENLTLEFFGAVTEVWNEYAR
tara:strand:+ start:232 stop:567 length:336 start_codon:yes stop_codon:yes gene_type:complete